MNRKEFVEYFSVVWFDNSGEPKTLVISIILGSYVRMF